jgi:hypothetical protein
MWWQRIVVDTQGDRVTGSARVVEPELDMRRPAPRPSPVLDNISKLVRWLMPQTQATGAPMRSIARELEEAFPSRDN